MIGCRSASVAAVLALSASTCAHAATLTLHPNADSDLLEWTYAPAPGGYTHLVDGDDGTRMRSSVYGERHYVELDDTAQSGSINSVTVWVRAYRDSAKVNRLQISIRLSGTTYDSGVDVAEPDPADYSHVWGTNPATGSPWDWTEVDALQAGAVRTTSEAQSVWVTELWVVVDYTPPVTPPGGFDLLLPGDGDTVASLTPTLDWGDSSDATAYRLVVDDDSDFSSPVVDDSSLTESTYAFAAALEPTTTYHWKVTATNVSGSADASNNPFTFTTPPAELSILSVTPSNGDPYISEVISVTVVVQNAGTAPTGSFEVALFCDRASAPSVGDTADRTQAVGALGAGGQTTVVFTNLTASSVSMWRMHVITDNGEAVPESDETNNVEGPVTVDWHGPDLVIPAIVPSNATPNAGETISVDVTVLNVGDRDAAAFVLELFCDSDTPPVVGAAGDDAKTVTGLTSGQQATVTFTGLTSASSGVWTMWAIADNGQAVTETGETNNVAGPRTVSWLPVPELVVVSVMPSETSPTPGSTITVEVTIANNGTADASGVDIGLYYNPGGPPSAGDPADRTIADVSVSAGAQEVVTFAGVTNASSGLWETYAVADVLDEVEEQNEANNTGGPADVNWGSVAGLRVVAPNGGEVWESGAVRQIEWKTFGGAGGTTVRIEYSDDVGTNWNAVVATTADDGTYGWDVPAVDSSHCLVRVTTEGGSFSDESDAEFTIITPQPGLANLTIVSVSPSFSVPNVGDTIAVAVTVRNDGQGSSGLFYVDLFFDRSAAPAVGHIGDRSAPVVALVAGEEATVLFEGVTSLFPATWHMYAIVDTGDYVDESSEGDNVAGPVPVGWSEVVDAYRITWPNGGEALDRGATYTITWEWTGYPGALANLEVSVDGGLGWADVVRGTDNDGSFDWTVDCAASDECRLRISNAAGTVSDVSDGVFAVREISP